MKRFNLQRSEETLEHAVCINDLNDLLRNNLNDLNTLNLKWHCRWRHLVLKWSSLASSMEKHQGWKMGKHQKLIRFANRLRSEPQQCSKLHILQRQVVHFYNNWFISTTSLFSMVHFYNNFIFHGSCLQQRLVGFYKRWFSQRVPATQKPTPGAGQLPSQGS